MCHLPVAPCRRSSAESADLLLAPLALMFNVVQLHVLRTLMGGQKNVTGGQEKDGERKGKKKKRNGAKHTQTTNKRALVRHERRAAAEGRSRHQFLVSAENRSEN